MTDQPADTAAVAKEPTAAPTAAAETTKPAATDTPAADTAKPADTPAPAAKAGDAVESETDGDAEDADFLGDGEEGADAKGADAKDGKEAGDKKPASAFDRDAVLKVAEAQLLAKAKTDEQKKAVTEKLDRIKKQLARYSSPEAAILAGMEAQEKLRAGQAKAKPGENATPEEIKAYREENGLPVDPKDIDVRVENHKWTEADQPLIDSFRQAAFEADIPQPAVKKLINWYLEAGNSAMDFQKQAHEAIDREDKKAARDDLRTEWGEEYKPRLELVDRLFKDADVFSDGLGEKIWNSRTPDGHMLRHSPSFLKLFGEVAIDRYGEGSIMTGSSREAIQSEEDRIRTIMKTDFDKYINEGLDKKLTEILNKKAAAGGKRGRAA